MVKTLFTNLCEMLGDRTKTALPCRVESKPWWAYVCKCVCMQEQQTALHISARLGNVDNVALLLQHGAQPNATSKDLCTALHITAKEGHEDVAVVLLDHGANQSLLTKVLRPRVSMACRWTLITFVLLVLYRRVWRVIVFTILDSAPVAVWCFIHYLVPFACVVCRVAQLLSSLIVVVRRGHHSSSSIADCSSPSFLLFLGFSIASS